MPFPDNRRSAPPPPIDRAHLAEQTGGDDALQAELLALFARQARTIVDQVEAAGPDQAQRERLLLLHTLSGSARAVGAWDVANEAQRLEEQARAGEAPGRPEALRRSVAAACDNIAGS